jgi:elongation factor 3
MDGFIAMLSDKKGAADGLKGLQGLVDAGDLKTVIACTDSIPAIVELSADKQKPVASAAADLAKCLFDKFPGWGARFALPQLKAALDMKSKPQVKEVALDVVEKFAKDHPECISREIEWLVSPISFLMNDIKASVKAKAKNAMIAIVACSGNQDLANFGATIVRAQESLKNVNECVEELAGCIFVQNVESPALAVLIPVLAKGLNERSEATQRRCCIIVDNMCKLVDDPREGSPLLGDVQNLVNKRADEMSDPDAREVAERAAATIKKMSAAGKHEAHDFKAFAEKEGASCDGLSAQDLNYCKTTAFALTLAKQTSGAGSALGPLGFSADVSEKIITAMISAAEPGEEEFIDDDETSLDLYKGSFSLAYGTVTLLRETRLHLKQFKFYGLLGPTNCGKTTLMRAISQEKVEGFPKRDELVTIFVEHDVEEREIEPPSKEWPLGKLNIDLNGIQFVVDTCNNIYKKSPPITEDQVLASLSEIGFKNKAKGINLKAAADMCNPITTYSGGWKVKMQLACAQLINADILMIDDPTGHLDVKNVAWVKAWLGGFKGSIISTSPNSSFLNEMCTHLIDFQDRKLRQFKGTKGSVLMEYVKQNPEKSAYFELSDKNESWVFPVPGTLEGIKSRGRAILKMSNVAFRYPTHEKPTVQDICLSVCMASRVAVIGANGAGKSTAIKLLIGELKPEQGTIWRHSNMRLAYVAQHAFHHLEKHMDKTPVQYILWRFAGADDRESLENQTKEINVDEEKLRKQPWMIDSKSGDVRKCDMSDTKEGKAERAAAVIPEAILNRQKNTKTKKYIYEVKWLHKSIELNSWVERDVLLAMGYEKLVCKKDEQEAAAAGLLSKPLTQPGVEKALKDFGVDSEAASHSPIASLSHGQKVKVVICASMWQNPHIVILDEPTNYLDRDGLGALVEGLHEFQGGVVIISHNEEFCNKVCQQKWIMEAGRLREEGEIQVDEEIADQQGPDELYDESGNKIEVNKMKTLPAKEVKKEIKVVEKKLKDHAKAVKDGKKANQLSDEEMWQLQDKLEELKQMLAASTA